MAISLDKIPQIGQTPRQFLESRGIVWDERLSTKGKLLYLSMVILVAFGVLVGCGDSAGLDGNPDLNNNDGGDDSDDNGQFLTPQPPGREPTPDLSEVADTSVRLLPMVGSKFIDVLSSFANSPVYEYDAEMNVVEHKTGADYPGAMVGAFELRATDGVAKDHLGIVMTSFDPNDVHLATRFGDSWVVNTTQLESPVTEILKPEADNVLEFDGIPGQFIGWGSFEGPQGVADIKLLFGVDEKRQLTGDVLYCDADQKCWPIAVGDAAPEGKGSGLASLVDVTLDLEHKLAVMNETFESWGVSPGDYQPEYHPEGDFGTTIGDGAFLTLDGNVLLYVGDASFDEIDPDDVEFDKNGKIKSIDGYEWDAEAGEWVEANETVTIGGVTLTVDENGVLTIKEVSGADDKTKAENRAKVDPAAWGCENCRIMKVDGKIFITPAGESETHLADWTGTDWNWQWDELDKLPGGNFIFDMAKLWTMNGSNEEDRAGAESDSARIEAFSGADQTMTGKGVYNQTIYLVSADGKKVVGAMLNSRTQVNSKSIAESGDVDGLVYFIDKDNNLRRMKVSDLKLRLRYWRAN